MAEQLIDILMPADQEGTESVVAAWLKNVGDPVTEHEPLVEISTDKVTVEVPAPSNGVLKQILIPADKPVAPGDLLGRIDANAVAEPAAVASSSAKSSTGTAVAEAPAPPPSKAPAARQPQARGAAPAVTHAPGKEVRLSPAVRRLVSEHGLDPRAIPGSGRSGRITHEDVLAFLEGGGRAVTSGALPPLEPIEARHIPHSPMRRMIADHMVQSALNTAPHVTAVFEADLTNVLAHRARHRASVEAQGHKLTLTAYFVAAAVRALHAVPSVNSTWHDDTLEIHGDCNIGMAAALDDGLIVPVIQQAQNLDLDEIAARLTELTNKARTNKLSTKDVQGGTFTITNHGVSGSLIASPIINQPQSAILGIGKLQKRVVVVEHEGNDSIQIRPMCYVTLTIDHRALDGFTANQFLDAFVKVLHGWK